MTRTGGAAVAAVLVAAAMAVSACGGPDVKAADPTTSLAPGVYPNGISLQVDNPVCSEAGDQFLCSLNVWYANGTPDDVTIDATTTVVKDDTGSSYSLSAGGDIASLAISAGTRTLVLWSARIPRPHRPAEVVWVAGDGSVATAVLQQSSPSPSVSTETPTPTPTESETPTETPTSSPSESATPTESETPSASPTPTRTSESPSPRPTRTRTPSPSATAPTGSIG